MWSHYRGRRGRLACKEVSRSGQEVSMGRLRGHVSNQYGVALAGIYPILQRLADAFKEFWLGMHPYRHAGSRGGVNNEYILGF